MVSFLNNFVTRWDGNSYIFLAQHWYVTKGDEAAFIVFPPFYPLLIRTLNLLVQNFAFSAFIISFVSIFLGVLMFYKLLRLDYSKAKSRWILILLLIFPVSYFFLTAYPESLFFLLIVTSFYFARMKRFRESFFLAGLATLTRPFGVLVWPSIFIEWWCQKKRNYWELILMVSILVLVGVAYLSLNYSLFGNPLAFSVFLKNNWQKSFTFPWTGILNSWQRGIKTDPSNWNYKYIVGYAEAVASTIPYIFMVLNVFIKKIRMRSSYLVYFVLATIFMTSTSFLLSVPRYLLSIPFFFITLGDITGYSKLKLLWVFTSVGLFVFFVSLFIKGNWAF